MRKLIVSEFLTLDGVFEDPGGAEGFERGGWAFQFERGPEGDKFKSDELFASDTALLGRRTYEEFAKAWPSRTGEFADKLNGMPKYVVSTTLDELSWNNSYLIKDNVLEEIVKLKQQPGKDIIVAGSAQLAHLLLQHGLVDELRLMVYPVVLGAGRCFFQEAEQALAGQLVEARPVGSGIVTLIYRLEAKAGQPAEDVREMGADGHYGGERRN